MRGWLLDTSVVSELRKPKPEPTVVAFVEAQPAETLFLSDVTVAEIRYGIGLIDDADRRAGLEAWVDRTLRPLFAGRTLAVTEDVVLCWKTMAMAGQKRGHTFGQPDLFVAAIAALEGLVVVTRDTRHFVAAGVPVFDPWTGVLHADAERRLSIEVPASLATVADALRSRKRGR
ncbi:MAG: type II toxin-antitoxin system VapC family toxin [Rhodoplanes sp.]|uniref:type II toxin-antitoxin system VapC family toxin n=1 Tax=Rhodoplanes sp. TaxID=1968906 RepID=UPI0018457FE1|nr:type II toxin-antitoxin system VapC family toxin [Rhodoplanes sp.]NVO17672.1 type II toxin-antitoxin system VapC family toxin [Rhodoplanes sp.]